MLESSEPSDSAALLYAEHSGELRSFLLGVLKNPDLAAEALQATFVKVLEFSDSARPETFKGWLFKVALNEALQIKRGQKRDGTLKDKPVWRTAEDHTHPDEIVIRQETIEQIRERIQELPPAQREIVHLRIFEDLTFADIAKRLDVPLGTVLTRMRAALKTLAQSLKQYDE